MAITINNNINHSDGNKILYNNDARRDDHEKFSIDRGDRRRRRLRLKSPSRQIKYAYVI